MTDNDRTHEEIDRLARLLAGREELLARLARESSRERAEALAMIGQLQSELAGRSQEIEQLAGERAAAISARDEKSRELAAATDQLAASEARFREATAQSATAAEQFHREITTLTGAREKLGAELAASRDAATRLEQQISALREEISLQRADGARLAGELEQAAAARETHQQTAIRLEREVSRLDGLLSAAGTQLAERERALAGLARTAAAERMEARRRIDSGEAALRTAHERLASLEARLASSAAEADGLQQRISTLSQELESERRERIAALDAAARQAAELNAEIARLQASLSGAQERARHFEARAAELSTAVEQDRAETAGELARREGRIAELDSMAATLRAEASHLLSERERLAALLEGREGELARALGEAEAARSELSALREQASRHLSERIETGVASVEEQLRRLAQVHEDRTQEITRLEQLLGEREKFLSELVGNQSEEVRRYEQLLESHRTRIRSLEAALGPSASSAAANGQAPAGDDAVRSELAALRAETVSLSRSFDTAVRKVLAESGRTAELANLLTRIEGKLASQPSPQHGEDRERRLWESLDTLKAEIQSGQAHYKADLAALAARSDSTGHLKKLQDDIERRLQRQEQHIQSVLAAVETISRSRSVPAEPAGDASSKVIGVLHRIEKSLGAGSGQQPRQPVPGDQKLWVAAAAITILVLAGLTALLWRQSRIEERLALLAPGQADLFTPGAVAASLPAPVLDIPIPVQTQADTVSIAGRAEQAGGAVIHLDGIFFAAVPVRGGKFLFDRIPAETGTHRFELWSFTPGKGFSPPVTGEIIRHPPAAAARLTPPRPAIRELNIERGPTDRREIGLTFDGDSAEGAEVILDTLRQKRIQTTIFLTGKFMDENPGLVRQMVQDGHEVGNHTQTHPHLTTYEQNNRHDTRPEVTREWFNEELLRPEARFEEITGVQMAKIWRAPYGEVNAQILRWAHELGYRHVGWTRDYTRSLTLDSLDWVINRSDRNYQPGAKIIDRLLDFERQSKAGVNGGIVLMHLGTRRPIDDSVGLHLPRLIDEWRDRGYRFVKVSTWLGDET
ncbi:MAG: polysaccharide deacetylase family protein [Deltaproteobacteria bacterium]|nr:polysaccharide deacetylase family protein [Deltaproteobacteria bacterium]